jgi:hypothetical protein
MKRTEALMLIWYLLYFDGREWDDDDGANDDEDNAF